MRTLRRTLKRNIHRMRAIPIAVGAGLMTAQAAGTADTNVTALIDNAKATFDTILPIALTILGIMLAISVGIMVWNRVARKRG